MTLDINTVITSQVGSDSLQRLQSSDSEVVRSEFNKLAQAQGLGELSMEEVVERLGDIQARAREFQPGGGGTPGVSNPNGSPVIDGVLFDMSAEDMAMILQALRGKTQDNQLQTARNGLEVHETKLKEKHEEALKKLDEAIAKSKEAAEKGKVSDVLGWIGKIAGVIGACIGAAFAVAAAVATGGVATVVAVIAVAGAIGAIMSLASSISQAAGGPPLELGGLLTKGITEMVKLCNPGMDEKEAEKAGKLIAGIVGTVTLVALADPGIAGQLAGSIAQAVAPDDKMAMMLAEAITTAVVGIAITITAAVLSGRIDTENISRTLKLAGAMTQGVLGVTGGLVKMASGGAQIAKSIDEKQVSDLRSDKALIDAMIMKLGKQMEEDREEIKKVIDEIMDGMNLVSQMIAAGGQSRMQISHNMGNRQTI